ncbi:helix-turn-helix domain-containing protein [Desulfovibrio inopinatus]|uniref:helix-turn-helix domain-containing protein n=1 Tax=Desulfovibrio inopinatus TaxID=102109 RepID=UPI00040ADDD4|nr:helix-turn-helix transcriptional regulator [Desulfovibrio inopinatus]
MFNNSIQSHNRDIEEQKIEYKNLADAIGVSNSHVSQIFAGRRQLTGELKKRFEVAYTSLTMCSPLHFTAESFDTNKE